MLVSEILPKVKANKYTYYNLDKTSVNAFKELYNYLKINKNKKVFLAAHNSFAHHLKSNDLDYLKKYKAMLCIENNIYK